MRKGIKEIYLFFDFKFGCGAGTVFGPSSFVAERSTVFALPFSP